MDDQLESKNKTVTGMKKKQIMKLLGQWYYQKLKTDWYQAANWLSPDDKADFNHWMTQKNQITFKYVLLTVNPPDITKFEDLHKKTIKCSKKKWIGEAKWCYETRGMGQHLFKNTPIGIHMHMQIIMNKEKKPSEIRRETFNTFKDVVEDNHKAIHFRFSNRENSFSDYIEGIKDGKDKKYAETDQTFRKQNNLPDWYATDGRKIIDFYNDEKPEDEDDYTSDEEEGEDDFPSTPAPTNFTPEFENMGPPTTDTDFKGIKNNVDRLREEEMNS